MAMYMCRICGMGVSSTDNHKCTPPLIPFNVLSNKTDDKKKPLFTLNNRTDR